MTYQEFTGLERLLKAVADPLRLRILRCLQHDAYGVHELCRLLKSKQPAMSHHLKVLAEAALVTRRREGTAIFYHRALASGPEGELVRQLFASIDARALPAETSAAIEHNQKLRSERSLQFFNQNIERFKAQQDLIADIDDYRETLNELLDSVFSQTAPSPAGQGLQRKQAIEIGPGEGRYLGDLARRFDHVIALDNSETMLSCCRDTSSEQQLGNVGFVLGDTHKLLDLSEELAGAGSGSRRADCIVANMVLHHNANPQMLIADCAQLMCEQGVLVISELCRHDQDWVREAAGDVWLGFDEALLDQWASASGLQKGRSSYTALRNGFSIQIHSYTKVAAPRHLQPANDPAITLQT